MSVARAQLPATAPVVIIGGGVMGVSAAYHLAAGGVRDVVLIERGSLGSGSTGRAAGGVRTQFSDRVNVEMAARSLDMFEHFSQRFDQEIDLRRVGYLFLLDSPEDVASFERNAVLQTELGLSGRMIDVAQARRLSPLIDTDGLLAAAYSPTDGYCTPESVVLGLAGAARRHGARLVVNCPVTAIETVGDRIAAVVTEAGRVETDTVICAAGAWSHQVGQWVGVNLPVTPLRRQILYTEPIPGLAATTPFTIDFGTSFYFRGEGQGLLLGMSDPDETPGFDLSRTDRWLPALGRTVARRAPALAEVGIAGGWAGLYEMTPDHNGLIGEADGISRFLYAGGFSGHGFMMGPAVGEVLCDLYLGRSPGIDISGFHATRFSSAQDRPELNIV